VVVVGSVNIDVVLRCDHLPGPGETVLAGPVNEGFGGKGANQAVAAARLGAPTRLIAAVGDDARGEAARTDLAAQGVDTTGVSAACVEAAVHACAGTGARVVYNLAPFGGIAEWVARLRPLVVLNETEAAQAVGGGAATVAASDLGRVFSAVVVTRGASGALLVENGTPHLVAADRVDVVDTTGAGDAFCGALAAALAAGDPLRRAVDLAVRAGTFAVTGHGARGALATRTDLTDPVRSPCGAGP
jgi:ribokinase